MVSLSTFASPVSMMAGLCHWRLHQAEDRTANDQGRETSCDFAS
jgi:hypothetical protein